MPKSNCYYWENKIEKNRQRDRVVNKQLKSSGWRVIRIWEYDIKKNIEISMRKILAAIES